MNAQFPLPPSERDFEVFRDVHTCGLSTRSVAERHEISQTRVRQIVRRVAQWLAEVLPPQAEIAKENEVRLARHIAADRFQHYQETMSDYWQQTKAPKFMGLIIRLITAQARLGVVSGLIDGLAADASEGLLDPMLLPDGEADPQPSPFDVRPSTQPPISDPQSPSLVSQPWTSDLEPSPSENPPVRDCSPWNQNESNHSAATAAQLIENHDDPARYDTANAPAITASEPPIATSRPLLTSPAPLPVTELRVTPDQPGVAAASSHRPQQSGVFAAQNQPLMNASDPPKPSHLLAHHTQVAAAID
jgi:hypothetical protein